MNFRSLSAQTSGVNFFQKKNIYWLKRNAFKFRAGYQEIISSLRSSCGLKSQRTGPFFRQKATQLLRRLPGPFARRSIFILSKNYILLQELDTQQLLCHFYMAHTLLQSSSTACFISLTHFMLFYHGHTATKMLKTKPA